MALPYVKKRIKQNLKVSKSQNMMRKKQNLLPAFSSHIRVCTFINHLQGISFDDDSDEDADWKKQSLDEADVRAIMAATGAIATMAEDLHTFTTANIDVNACVHRSLYACEQLSVA